MYADIFVIGFDTVFAKGGVCTVGEKRAIADILPAGYTHTFILRDPRKSVLSMYKFVSAGNMECEYLVHCFN